ncbi:MAG: PilN domain-containing protein [Gammaproteobacteria bacterium]|nr:PilN domain-containing protein [Gammaproteobacteria bacterium]
MKQNINLFQPAVRHRGERFNSRQLLMVWAGSILVLAVAQLWLDAGSRDLQQQLAQAELDLVTAEETLNARTASLVAGSDSKLESRLNEALRELDLRQTILGLVSGNGAGDTDGFSSQLRSLARQDANGVWLTRVSVSAPASRTTLEGRALSPEAVPLYLRQLSSEPALAGQRFDLFEIHEPDTEGEAIHFSLNRRRDADGIRLVQE